jgi:hypothetical protein
MYRLVSFADETQTQTQEREAAQKRFNREMDTLKAQNTPFQLNGAYSGGGSGASSSYHGGNQDYALHHLRVENESLKSSRANLAARLETVMKSEEAAKEIHKLRSRNGVLQGEKTKLQREVNRLGIEIRRLRAMSMFSSSWSSELADSPPKDSLADSQKADGVPRDQNKRSTSMVPFVRSMPEVNPKLT